MSDRVVESEADQKSLFGFWVYLMTDCVLFAALFAVYGVLHGATFGGVTSRDIFDLPFALTETLVLLLSSFMCGLALLASQRGKKTMAMACLATTFVLGSIFLVLEVSEFRHLVSEGHSWRASGFLSAFFTLVGTHGLHIMVGLLWILVLLVQLAKRGFTQGVVRRLTMFGLFWHFLDIVWIFIFTFVYLVGVL